MSMHVDILCNFVKIECKNCKKNIKKMDMKTHTINCKRLINCNKCNKKYVNHQLKEHAKSCVVRKTCKFCKKEYKENKNHIVCEKFLNKKRN